MKPPYALHELAYERIKATGGKHWADRESNPDSHPIDPRLEGFLASIFETSFAPRRGAVLELGCGSAVLLRWLVAGAGSGSGFARGAGMDISPTAIALAREQSEGLPVELFVGDVAAEPHFAPGSFDLVMDGHCLHCITSEARRRRFLANAVELVAPGGLFVVATMCGPILDGRLDSADGRSRLVGPVQYCRHDRAADYEEARVIDGGAYVPQRYFAEWRAVVDAVCDTGLEVVRVDYRAPGKEEDICGEVHVAARKP